MMTTFMLVDLESIGSVSCKMYVVSGDICLDLIFQENTYQIDFLFSLQLKRIDPISVSDKTWDDMFRIHLEVAQRQRKILIRVLSLSFLTFKPLLLFFILYTFFNF